MRNPERRMSAVPKIERRTIGDRSNQPVIFGHASVFNQWTTLYEGQYYTWREMVRPGAYSNAIATKQDVKGLFNHDPNFVMGSTDSGTVLLREDSVGLYDEIYPSDQSQTIRDLVLIPLEREDIKGQSIGFYICDDGTSTVENKADGSRVVTTCGDITTFRYEGDMIVEEREIIAADLCDVSVVTYPQFTQTDVALRSRALGADLESRVKQFDRPHVSRSRQAALSEVVSRRLRLAEAMNR